MIKNIIKLFVFIFLIFGIYNETFAFSQLVNGKNTSFYIQNADKTLHIKNPLNINVSLASNNNFFYKSRDNNYYYFDGSKIHVFELPNNKFLLSFSNPSQLIGLYLYDSNNQTLTTVLVDFASYFYSGTIVVGGSLEYTFINGKLYFAFMGYSSLVSYDVNSGVLDRKGGYYKQRVANHIINNNPQYTGPITDETGFVWKYWSAGVPNGYSYEILQTINQTCTQKLINFPYKNNLAYTQNSTLIGEILPDLNDTYYVEYKQNNNDVSTENIKISYIENFSKINTASGFIYSFDSLEDPLTPRPEIHINSTHNLNYFEITSTGAVNNSLFLKEYGTGTYTRIEYNKVYDLKNIKDFSIRIDKAYFHANNIGINFGTKETQIQNVEVCVNNDNGQTSMLGQVLTQEEINQINSGSYDTDNIFISSDIIVCDSLDITCHINNLYNKIVDFFTIDLFDLFSSIGENIFNPIKNKIVDMFGLNTYLQYLDFTFPQTPNTHISLPVPYINQGKIDLKIVNTDLGYITDRLGKNAIEYNYSSHLFITFIFILIYISFRFLILYFLFFSFKLYHKYLSFLSNSLFGVSIEKSGTSSISTLAFYIFYLIFLFSVFVFLFDKILNLDIFINTIISYINAFFTSFLLSFGDYAFFKSFIDYFFLSIISGFFIYLVFLFKNKFSSIG